jgi:Methyltransferase domain
MRSQRPAHLSAAIDAVAESLPFADRQFDAAMATFTVHQWANLNAGLGEMRRVTAGPIVILSCDPALVCNFWLFEYAPEVLRAEAGRYPPMAAIASALKGECKVAPVKIPLYCKDGFNEAYYGRPERLLNPDARLACSAWSFVEKDVEERYVRHLASDLADGTWDSRWGHLRAQSEYEGSLRLIVSNP